MNRQKIAFVLTSFVVGGVEKSFLNLLDNIDRKRYKVIAFLPDDKGEWTPILEKKCEVRYLKNERIQTILRTQLQKGNIFEAGRSLFYRMLSRIFYKRAYRKSTEYFIRSMPRVKEKFDCAVAYQIINDDCVLSSLYRINAKKKAVWSHAYIHKQESIYGIWYDKFDKIFCVSGFAKKALDDNFPFLENKTEVFHNITDNNRIRQLAQAPIDALSNDGEIVLATVGRLSPEKGQIQIPKTARLLCDAGYKFKWYIVGDGDDKERLLYEIKKERVENCVMLLGNKDNPYPYMNACDIYVQTSYVEGWGLTVSEAKILCKPIVTTDAGVMAEQIENGFNGIIVPKPEPEILAEKICGLIDSPKLREAYSCRLRQQNTGCSAEMEKLYQFLESE